jgi:hypothetical protein
VGLRQRRHSRLGMLLQFECLGKMHGAQALRSSSGRPVRGGLATSTVPERAKRRNAVALLRLKKKPIDSCARDQVVIARPPPVLTPPRRYRRSLMSKGRFAMSITVICVRTRSGLPKRRYHVVIDYVGGPLRHRGKAGPRLFRGS